MSHERFEITAPNRYGFILAGVEDQYQWKPEVDREKIWKKDAVTLKRLLTKKVPSGTIDHLMALLLEHYVACRQLFGTEDLQILKKAKETIQRLYAPPSDESPPAGGGAAAP